MSVIAFLRRADGQLDMEDAQQRKTLAEAHPELMLYTSATGLNGIIESQKLWATHAAPCTSTILQRSDYSKAEFQSSFDQRWTKASTGRQLLALDGSELNEAARQLSTRMRTYLQ